MFKSVQKIIPSTYNKVPEINMVFDILYDFKASTKSKIIEIETKVHGSTPPAMSLIGYFDMGKVKKSFYDTKINIESAGVDRIGLKLIPGGIELDYQSNSENVADFTEGYAEIQFLIRKALKNNGFGGKEDV